MKKFTLTIEATDEVAVVNGATARVWTGTTEAGVPCIVFVTRLAVHDDHRAAFEREAEDAVHFSGSGETPSAPSVPDSPRYIDPNVYDARLLS